MSDFVRKHMPNMTIFFISLNIQVIQIKLKMNVVDSLQRRLDKQHDEQDGGECEGRDGRALDNYFKVVVSEFFGDVLDENWTSIFRCVVIALIGSASRGSC